MKKHWQREQKSRILFPNKTVASSVFGATLLVLCGSCTLQALDSLCSSSVEEPQTLIWFCRWKIIEHTLFSGMRQSSMEICPLMKNMPLLLYFRGCKTERSPWTVQDLGRTFIVSANVTVNQRFQTGERTLECKKMERHIFVPNTLFNMGKFTLMST